MGGGKRNYRTMRSQFRKKAKKDESQDKVDEPKKKPSDEDVNKLLELFKKKDDEKN
ncbi:MAG: hypothetical protein Q8Q42_00570 [Nanoarchaeota archaeon]|nr:hypothetical protein [Nanoarchaeota archaeon]